MFLQFHPWISLNCKKYVIMSERCCVVNLKATLTAREKFILAKEANSPSPTEKKRQKKDKRNQKSDKTTNAS